MISDSHMLDNVEHLDILKSFFFNTEEEEKCIIKYPIFYYY